MLNSQNFAVRIEQIMRSVFECDRSGMGGLVESDYIRKYPFTAMMSTIMYLCDRNDSNGINVASDFFDKYSYYGQWSIDQLLGFESETAEIDGCNYELEYANGEAAMNAIIAAFSKVCTQLK